MHTMRQKLVDGEPWKSHMKEGRKSMLGLLQGPEALSPQLTITDRLNRAPVLFYHSSQLK